VPECRRGDDLDLDAGRPHPLDRVGDEPSGGVSLETWIGGREDEDAHSP
jgi:hypothetical protein